MIFDNHVLGLFLYRLLQLLVVEIDYRIEHLPRVFFLLLIIVRSAIGLPVASLSFRHMHGHIFYVLSIRNMLLQFEVYIHILNIDSSTLRRTFLPRLMGIIPLSPRLIYVESLTYFRIILIGINHELIR